MFLLSYLISVAVCLILTGLDFYRQADYKLSVGDLLILLFITSVPVVNSICVLIYGISCLVKLIQKLNFDYVIWSKKK